MKKRKSFSLILYISLSLLFGQISQGNPIDGETEACSPHCPDPTMTQGYLPSCTTDKPGCHSLAKTGSKTGSKNPAN